MVKERTTRRLTSGFNLGGLQAESDPLLEDAFFETSVYRAISSRADRHSFIIGRTGSGKSSILRRLELMYPEHTISITPQDLTLPYVSDSQIIQKLSASGVHLDPLFIALWKHVLIVEVIRHRYKIDSPEAKQNVLTSLFARIKRDPRKTAALEYLEEFEGKFWNESNLRIREITDSFERDVKDTISTSFSAGLNLKAGHEQASSEKSQVREEWVEQVQKIVNDTQLVKLNQMMRVLNEDVLDSKQNFTYIVIDDLDLDWVDDAILNGLIRCLFRAVLDFQRVRSLKIIVALRTNIFDSLDFGRTGGQEEKFRGLTLRVRWSEADLTELVNTRIRAAAATYGAPVESVKDLLPATNKTRGNAMHYLMRRTLLRPRDLISYLNIALEASTGRPRITWDRIHDSELQYSNERLLALRDEWKSTFPDIDRLFGAFAQAPLELDRDELGRIFSNIALLIAERDFRGEYWLGPLVEATWDTKPHTWEDRNGSLIRLLFDVGFLGCGSEMLKIAYSDRIPDLFASASAVMSMTQFSVHPAFRQALGIARSVQSEGTDGAGGIE